MKNLPRRDPSLCSGMTADAGMAAEPGQQLTLLILGMSLS
jgi:hypothetical protein